MTEIETPLAEADTPGTWLIQTGKPRGRKARRAHYFADGSDRAVCGIPDFHRKASHAAATRPHENWLQAFADDPSVTHHGSDDLLSRTVCGNCLHELRVLAGTAEPRTDWWRTA